MMRLNERLFEGYISEDDFEIITYEEVLEKVIRIHKNGVKASIEDVDRAVKFFEETYGGI